MHVVISWSHNLDFVPSLYMGYIRCLKPIIQPIWGKCMQVGAGGVCSIQVPPILSKECKACTSNSICMSGNLVLVSILQVACTAMTIPFICSTCAW